MTFAKETGSLVNHLYSRMTKGQPEVTVGMGATTLHYTDRKAGTIIEVFKHGKFQYVVVQRDTAKRTDDLGMSDSQDYSYTPDPKGYKTTFRFRDERWEEVYKSDKGRWKVSKGTGLVIGRRDEHYDFSF